MLSKWGLFLAMAETWFTDLNHWSLWNSNQNADKSGINIIKCCCVSRTVKKTLSAEEAGDFTASLGIPNQMSPAACSKASAKCDMWHSYSVFKKFDVNTAVTYHF